MIGRAPRWPVAIVGIVAFIWIIPIVGIVMRALIDAVEAGHDHDRDPVRLTLPRTGLEIDLSAWSRRRPVAAERPRSVLG